MRRLLINGACLTVSLAAFSWAIARQDEQPDGPKRIFKDDLIENLAGDWKLTRKIRGKEVANRAAARWVLNHQFLELHMTDVASPPEYEAIVLIGYSYSDKRYVALVRHVWRQVLGHRIWQTGRGEDEFAFQYPDGPFFNTFSWDARAKEWTFRLENSSKDGKRSLFAEDTLRRQ